MLKSNEKLLKNLFIKKKNEFFWSIKKIKNQLKYLVEHNFILTYASQKNHFHNYDKKNIIIYFLYIGPNVIRSNIWHKLNLNFFN